MFYISLYISRHHFSKIIKISFKIIWKKDFRHKFSFFNGFTQTLLTRPLSYWSKSAKRDNFFFVDAP